MQFRLLSWTLVLALGPGATVAETFVFHLEGGQEVPPVSTPERGGCFGRLDVGAAELVIDCSHNVTGATLIHIHKAAAGANGPPVFDLGSPASPVHATWAAMSVGDIADLQAGLLYVNVHSAGRPDGAIRGQVLPRTVGNFVFALNGAQQVPPDGSGTTGACTADLNLAATDLAVACTHDVAMPTLAHLHRAPFGVNGTAAFVFPSAASPLAVSAPLIPSLVAEMAAGFLYVNVHSVDSPDGEIRGQIGGLPTAPTTGTIRIKKRTVPGGGLGFGFTDDVPGSPGVFGLDDGETETFTSVAAGTYHFTEDDPATTPGGYALADVQCDDADSGGNVFSRVATVVLAAGETVTCTFRNSILGPATDLFVFELDGAQEVPPVVSVETGGCYGRLDQAGATLALICVHDLPDAALIHVHRASAGANGPVVFDLGSPASPVQANWTGMSATDIVDLLAGKLYVNVHTTGRPAGEIRGQILARTVGSFAFGLTGGQQVPPNPSPATGACTVDLNVAATEVLVACAHDVALPTAAHLHDAPFGQNGPLVFAFPSAASPFGGTVPLTPRGVAELAASFLYVNVHGTAPAEARVKVHSERSLGVDSSVHATDSPNGEIRGQIGDVPAGPTTGTITIRKRTVPGGGVGFGFTDNVPGSPGTFGLDDGQVQTFLGVAPGTYRVVETDPTAVFPGYALTDLRCDDLDSSAGVFARAATVRLSAGEAVTCTFTNLRLGAGEGYVFDLRGSQEVPPVSTAATGGCFGRLDRAAAQFALVCSHNVTGAALMHVHRAPVGQNGPVVFDLGNPASPVQAIWAGMTAAEIDDLAAGRLYLNIHTAGRPAGEIRGQVSLRTIGLFDFGLDGAQQVPPDNSTATGNCTADLNIALTELAVACTHDVPMTTAAHLHNAPRGSNGPVVFDFSASPLLGPHDHTAVSSGLAVGFAGNVPLSPRGVAELAAGFFYVNVHSVDSPDGEIRGQILPGAVNRSIPALSTWGLLALVLLLAGAAIRKLG